MKHVNLAVYRGRDDGSNLTICETVSGQRLQERSPEPPCSDVDLLSEASNAIGALLNCKAPAK
jgi:hypothetical protein